MKHYLFSSIFFFQISILLAQIPQGKLFTYTNNGQDSAANRIGYFQLPDQNYIQLDTISSSDFAIKDGKLYSASGYNHLEHIPVYIYDLQTNTKTDTIEELHARQLDFWKNYLVSVNDSFPYFSVQEADPPYNQLFSLDSSYLPHQPVDMVINQNKAFLLYQTEVKIVDLKLQDTLPSVLVYHPWGFGSGFNTYLTPFGPDIYISVDYATGAIRSSFMSIDTSSLKIDTTFHAEGFMNLYRPVPGENEIFLYNYKSYYDIATDSIYRDTLNSFFSFSYMIAHDPESHTDFVWGQLQDSVEIYQDDSLVSSIFPPGQLINAVFRKEESSNSIKETLTGRTVRIFPNPASETVFLEFEEPVNLQKVCLYDLWGRKVEEVYFHRTDKKYEINLPSLASGAYMMVMINDAGNLVKKIWIQ
ncbi:MAG: T9SS type A sorting domain-containing protein [Bacteroidetes bacterium]|nr:T9SS type A sorting domain-containing protein [Bacteroidota bacterium]